MRKKPQQAIKPLKSPVHLPASHDEQNPYITQQCQIKSNINKDTLKQSTKMAIKRCLTGLNSRLAIVLGGQWGDEGKGKLVDLLSDKYDVAARFNGGDNAGHTVVKNGVKYAFHLVPCGVLSPKTVNILGNGCVVNLEGMFKELAQLDKGKINYKGRMLLSDRAHLITQYQIAQDAAFEKKQGLGTTKKGIGPTYSAKIQRFGIRVGDLKNWEEFQQKYNRMKSFYPELEVKTSEELAKFKDFRERLQRDEMVVDGVEWINKAYQDGKRILAEGANACLLDIDLGTYPFVTSSSTSIGGFSTGLGMEPRKIQTVIGVVKAYTTRVGEGPFPTELFDNIGDTMRKNGHEFGTTTGRPRRCGWLDLNLVRYTHMVNGYDSINITKLDILDTLPEIKVAVEYKLNGKAIHSVPASLADFKNVEVVYETLKGWQKDTSKIRKKEDLPKQALAYLQFIEKQTKIPISWVGTGPGHDTMIRMI